MSRKYTNPPLVEAVCEFQFNSDSEWDITVPGLVYDKLKGDFPIRETLAHTVDVTIQAGAEEGIQQHLQAASERIRFWREDKQALVQVGPHLLAINHLRPYPTWEGYLPLIEMAYGAYVEVAQPKGIGRIELRYINRIEIPSPTISLEDYFQFYPYIGPNFPHEMGAFITGVQLAYDDDNALRVQLANAPAERPDCSTIVLDLDYFLGIPQGLEIDGTSEWLQVAHDRIEQIFEASITDKLRSVFQEETK